MLEEAGQDVPEELRIIAAEVSEGKREIVARTAGKAKKTNGQQSWKGGDWGGKGDDWGFDPWSNIGALDENICWDHMKGTCKKGNKCKWVH